MKKRSICVRCNYPKSVCVCSFIKKLDIPMQLIILQHPLEAKHAKNSGRLISLCIENSQTIIGESEQDFAQIKQQVASFPHKTWVLYPNSLSHPLEEHKTHAPDTMPDNLIVIDSTWRKATKIWQLNPWLQSLPSWHFNLLPDNQYRIRKTKLTHSLSTLEASAHALKIMLNTDTQPLLNIFDEMQKNQEKFIPR